MTVLVTGAAGFIGAYTCQALAARGERVVGLDNHNDYYDPQLKRDRVAALCPGLDIRHLDLVDRDGMAALFDEVRPDRVVHLAAQAGVRYSLQNPHAYVASNLDGFVNVLELCRHRGIAHLVYASSSSVYGDSATPPFSEDQRIDRPRSLYAATKAANELMAYTYAQLYGLRATGLRFFTVYGPWGRPDMALFKFTKAILAGETIDVYGNGKLVRDFTFIDDIVEGILRVLDKPAAPDAGYDALQPNPGTSTAPYRIFNIGNSNPTVLMDYIAALESALGTTANKRMLPIQPGDMHSTSADTRALQAWVNFAPSTTVRDGVQRFVDWYRSFYRV